MTFNDFCHDHGVLAPPYIEPGRWLRVPTVNHPRKKNGVVRLSDDGRVGWVRDWASMDTPAVWKADGGKKEGNFVDSKEIESRRKMRLYEMEQATMKARGFWSRCLPLNGPTEYLKAKDLMVDGCAGIRRTESGETVVPMFIKGELASVQRIFPNGEKLFWAGAPSKGAIFRLNRKDGSVTIFCEGLATGLTIYEAIPQSSVIITFSAANLALVAGWMKPTGLAVVAADNDHETEGRTGLNPGVEFARKAAESLKVGVAIPDVRGSDWNDYLHERLLAKRDDDMLSKFRKRPEVIRQSVLGEIRMEIMKHAKFIPA